MRVTIQNLGILRAAEFEIGDLTIICGKNNTGKTYATYAFYGFLHFWHQEYAIPVATNLLTKLVTEGRIQLPLEQFARKSGEDLREASKAYSATLDRIFATGKRRFEKASFAVDVAPQVNWQVPKVERVFRSGKSGVLRLSKEPESSTIQIIALVEDRPIELPRFILRQLIGSSLRDILYGTAVPRPFVASAERTGAAIFRKELDFARNRLLEKMTNKDGEVDPMDLLAQVHSGYALPVHRNVEFTRTLESLSGESPLMKNNPELLDEFSDIIGGSYRVKRDELFFVPENTRGLRLGMAESSSAVRSVLDIGFYLRHVASPGDILIIDEPELNLHPANQRRLARLFARLVNAGIKIFITTHSDYIVKEFNTLIMLRKDDKRIRAIAALKSMKKMSCSIRNG